MQLSVYAYIGLIGAHRANSYLLRAGADPNYGGAPTRLWDSALLKQWETEVEKSELVGPSAGEPLLSFGIPIQIATESGNFEMAKLLYEYGAELPPKLVAATSLHSPFPQVAAFVAEAGDCFAT